MKAVDEVVCGGGWKERKERPIKVKAVCCAILFFFTPLACSGLDRQILAMAVLLSFMFLLASIFLFIFERPKMWWGPPDANRLDVTRPLFGARNDAITNVPKHDLHNLH